MNRFIILLITIFISLSLLTSCNDNELKDGVYHLQIYATNDVHARFFDTLYVESKEIQAYDYSMASVAEYMKEVRDSSLQNNVILLDIGDHLQGDNAAFYYNFIDTVSEHLFSRVSNFLNYDAIIVGNHDIEPGPRVYNRVTEELNMPYLAANAIDTKTGKPFFKPYTVLNRDGVKVAIIGMTNPNIPNWLSPHLWEDIEFDEIVPSLNYWVKYVTEKENPHLLVVAMHAGLGNENLDSKENPARFVAKHVKGIDIIFAAHDHKITAEKHLNGDKEIWILEGGSRASTLSKANIELTIKDGNVISTSILGENISMSGVEPNSTYNNFFREDFLKIKKFTNRPVGVLNNDISSRDAYFGSCAYVDMIHTLQLNASGAHISFAAPLSFDIKKKKGVLNYQDLLDLYPFENQLYVIELSGLEIKNYLEYSYSKWVNPNPIESGHLLNLNISGKGERGRFNSAHYNFDSAAGILYEVDITKQDGERVNIISLANKAPFNLNSKYRVALTSYRASGGGDILHLGARIPKEEIPTRQIAMLADIRELLYNQIQEEGFLEAKKLNHWKFTPEKIADKFAIIDYKLLYR